MKTFSAIKAFTRSGFAACVLLAASASHAGLLGKTVHSDFRFPTSGAGFYDYGNAVVGAGVEFSAVPNTNNLFFDLTNSTITIGDGGGSSGFASATFNGFGFDDALSAIDDIIGVSIDATTTLGGFGAGRLSFTADQILINLESLQFLQGQQLVLNLSFRDSNSVPEPASLGMVALALAAGAGAARLRRGA